MPRSTCRGKRGQAVVLLLALIVALAAVVVWIGTTHLTAVRRLRLRDGGDAAALSAARWQAAGLNLVGELNLIQAYMLADDVQNAEAAIALHELRKRVQLATPFLALLNASATARANDLPEVPEAADVIREMADSSLYEDFYPGAQEDFREMAHTVALQPLHAAPASPGLDPTGANLLVNQDFYEAILGNDWCWFWFNAYSFLQHYSGRGAFGPLPEVASEPFLGLRLATTETSLQDLLNNHVPLDAALRALGHPTLPPPPHDPDSPTAQERTLTVPWSTFGNAWGRWDAMHELPIDGTLKDTYDYFGASAAISVADGEFLWLAVAKAFGHLEGENPTTYDLVLGGFDDVRLIPVDAGDVGITPFNPAWIRHLHLHLKPYVETGLTHAGCRYCTALRTFDNPAWRAQALTWLFHNGESCRRPTTGSGGSSGGARFGH